MVRSRARPNELDPLGEARGPSPGAALLVGHPRQAPPHVVGLALRAAECRAEPAAVSVGRAPNVLPMDGLSEATDDDADGEGRS